MRSSTPLQSHTGTKTEIFFQSFEDPGQKQWEEIIKLNLFVFLLKLKPVESPLKSQTFSLS